MLDKVLLVERDPLVLAYYEQILGKHFLVETAHDPEEALDILQRRGPFAVLVSDLCAPEHGDDAFFSDAERICPDIVKIVLTQSPSLAGLMRAVNENQVFGFFDKACDPLSLIRKIRSAIAHNKRLRTKDAGAKAKVLTNEERLFLAKLHQPERVG